MLVAKKATLANARNGPLQTHRCSSAKIGYRTNRHDPNNVKTGKDRGRS
jgi:hypothetical protein